MIRIAFALTCVLLAAGDWPQFRGPRGDGVSDASGLPDKWSATENLRWKTPLPGRGLSSPVVAKGKLFLTANDGMNNTRLRALGFDAETGKQLWERQFWATGQTNCHPKTCMACPTPVTDGDNVYCVFATNDVVCLSADGDVRWIRSFAEEFPKMINHVGRSSSPVLFKDVLILQMENQGQSLVCGVETSSGKTRWSVPRGMDNNWNTPTLVTHGGQTDLIVSSPDGMAAIDPATGSVRWKLDDEKFNPIASPSIAAGDLILAAGKGMVAIKAAAGDAPTVSWKSLKLSAFTASPVVADGKIYTITARDSVLNCGSLEDGKVIWDVRVKGPFSASPILAGGKLYLVNEEGTFTIIDVSGKEGKVVGTIDTKETVLATPAVANNALYYRTDNFLYCVGKKAG